MNKIIISQLAKTLNLKPKQIETVLNLLSEGSTVPFIARYRKEATDNLDEDQIRVIEKEFAYQANLLKRKEEVIRLIAERGMMTEELEKSILEAVKLQTVEDLYLPFKEKRKTKATEAIKMGLEPLAKFIYTFPKTIELVNEEAKKYLNDEVEDVQFAIKNAGFIIAENISEVAEYREYIRKQMYDNGIVVSKVKRGAKEKDEKSVYEMYYEFSQSVKKIPGYRILAFNRGEKEKILNVKIDYNIEAAYDFVSSKEIKDESSKIVELFNSFIIDGLNRLVVPSIEREIRGLLTEKADTQAIGLFADNLDILIMQPPLKNKMVLSLDPAFRTGCKLAVLDETGALLDLDVIYPHQPKNDKTNSKKTLNKLFDKYSINQIVIGNGTASRESEEFIENYLSESNKNIPFNLVSEAGASVYSASKIAQNEFPDLQVEMRSAVSIGRRIQDPMAELVKIDPKSIGVGQYQHDVNQKNLAESLDFVMLKNINKVGIDVNTASAELLKYVSGLDKTIAKNIVEYRQENGPFKNRRELLKVKRLGAKAYEQAAGFLKILDGAEVFDQTFIHPESYPIATKILEHLELEKKDIGTEKMKEICSSLSMIEMSDQLEISEILCNDIISAFIAPNIDIREKLVVASFDKSITKIEDLKEQMKIQGQVRNIVEFGGFVDIGLKNDALVHISQISNSFVSNVADHLKIGDVKTFRVIGIDYEKGRIQLSLKDE